MSKTLSNFYYDLEIETVLQCPVCYEVPPNVIYMCKIGHHVCDKCRARLTLCPTCQAPLTASRNYLAEALISKLEILRCASDTSQENKKSSVTKPTEKVSKIFPKLPDNCNRLKPQPLPSGIYNCLLESCRHSKNGNFGQLFSHIQEKHSHIYEKFQNESATFSHTFENFCLMKKRHKFHRCFKVSNMGLFFLNIQLLNDNYLNCWLSMPVPISTANNFYCQFQFSEENKEIKKYSLINQVASNLQSEAWLLERGRIFVLSPYEHELGCNDFFSLSIKIVFRPPGLLKNVPIV